MDQLPLLKVFKVARHYERSVGAVIDYTKCQHTGPNFETKISRSPALSCPTATCSRQSAPSSQNSRREDGPVSLPPGALELMSCDPLLGRCRKRRNSVQSPTRHRLTQKRPCAHGRVFLAGGRFEPSSSSKKGALFFFPSSRSTLARGTAGGTEEKGTRSRTRVRRQVQLLELPATARGLTRARRSGLQRRLKRLQERASRWAHLTTSHRSRIDISRAFETVKRTGVTSDPVIRKLSKALPGSGRYGGSKKQAPDVLIYTPCVLCHMELSELERMAWRPVGEPLLSLNHDVSR
jgi:hypothetical protein